jgi:hypothetical protein
MTHPFVFFCLAGMAASAGADTPRTVFAFADDSLRTSVIRLGGKADAVADSLPAGLPCDSLAAGNALAGSAWFEVEVADLRAGTDLRFPVEEAELRRGLRQACGEGREAAPDRIAAGLRVLAARLKVRMRPEGTEAGK